MGTDKTGSVRGGLVADPGGYDSWGEQRPHHLGLHKQLIAGGCPRLSAGEERHAPAGRKEDRNSLKA